MDAHIRPLRENVRHAAPDARDRHRRAAGRRRPGDRGRVARGRARYGARRARPVPGEGAAEEASLRTAERAARAGRSGARVDRDPVRGPVPQPPRPPVGRHDLRRRGRARLRLDPQLPVLHPHARAAAGPPRAGARRHARHGALAGDRLSRPAGGPRLGCPRRRPVCAGARADLRLVPDLRSRRRPRRRSRGARGRADRPLRRLLRHLSRPVVRLPPRRDSRRPGARQRLPAARRERLVPEPDPDRHPLAVDRLSPAAVSLPWERRCPPAAGRARAARHAARGRAAAQRDRVRRLRAAASQLHEDQHA